MNKGPITQDWVPVVLKKKNPTKQNTTKEVKYNAGTNKKKTDVNMRKLDETELGTIEKVERSLSLMIQQARLAKKLKQSDLAKKCNLPVNVIQKYENGKATPTGQELQKLSKALGVTLRKHPKKK